MLYNVVTDEWGGNTYVPTTLGNVLLCAILVALLAGAAAAWRAAARKSSKPVSGKLTARQLTFCAMTLALGTVLSNIKVFDFPYGGSITLLSMLVICLPGYWFGLGAGLMTGVAYGVLQLIIDPYVLHPWQLVVDYLLAFGALGLSGCFTNARFGLLKGYALGVIGRYIFVTISGWIFFGAYAWEGWNPFLYSLAYNATYIFSEAAITLVILAIPSVRNMFGKLKNMATT